MRVNCKSCGAAIPAQNLNLDRMVAKCGACHAVFAFAVDGAAPPPGASAGPEAGAVPRPQGLMLDRMGGELTITKRWFSWVLVIFFSVFTVAWNGVSWFMMLSALSEFGEAGGYVAAFLGLFCFVGALMAYFTLAVMVNATVITVGRELTVRQGPLPMPGNRTLSASEVGQLYVTERVSRSSSNHGRSSISITFDLRARLKNGDGVILLRSLVEAEEALYLEQLMEAELGIQNEPVRGEL